MMVHNHLKHSHKKNKIEVLSNIKKSKIIKILIFLNITNLFKYLINKI